VILPYKISTLLYCFNSRDEVLLMERTREPNRGMWSPFGGKLVTDIGESPYDCACREAAEEAGLIITPRDLHLFGIVSEVGYQGQAHWLMFLFEIKTRLEQAPPPHGEGRFEFFPREALNSIAMPRTDVEQIWPLVWKHRGGFFAAHCRSSSEGQDCWTLEESRPAFKP
jgi:8-oxo-dGTP diphosphatase